MKSQHIVFYSDLLPYFGNQAASNCINCAYPLVWTPAVNDFFFLACEVQTATLTEPFGLPFLEVFFHVNVSSRRSQTTCHLRLLARIHSIHTWSMSSVYKTARRIIDNFAVWHLQFKRFFAIVCQFTGWETYLVGLIKLYWHVLKIFYFVYLKAGSVTICLNVCISVFVAETLI